MRGAGTGGHMRGAGTGGRCRGAGSGDHVISSYSTRTPKGTCLSVFGGSGEAAGGGTIIAVSGGGTIVVSCGIIIAADGGDSDFAAGGGWLGRRGNDFSADLTDVNDGSSTFALRSALLEAHFRARGYTDFAVDGGWLTGTSSTVKDEPARFRT